MCDVTNVLYFYRVTFMIQAIPNKLSYIPYIITYVKWFTNFFSDLSCSTINCRIILLVFGKVQFYGENAQQWLKITNLHKVCLKAY